ncbi:DUF3592 domain-containing protein [Corynebacterium qintianiae]|nr:DUF3592 domain-containing protein [Corynebacterium qintianiae]
MLGVAAMVAGPAINDARIMSSPGRGMATVTEVGPLRTSIEFQDEQGRYHSPRSGLLYPSGLGEGQRVWVTFATFDPELVKVEGRGWTLSIIPAVSVAAASTLVATAAYAGVNAAFRRREARVAP